MKRVLDPMPAGTAPADSRFAETVIRWQKQHGRNHLPWQATRDAYRIWLSEIMLQQTQVATVIPYYQRFLSHFPDVVSLADAPVEEVMAHWSGLGYYTRARNLHRCAQRVRDEYGGVFPADPALLADLPGIGRSTAAAIAAFSHGARAAILDGNVKRVFCRVFGIEGYPGTKAVETDLWQRAERLLPQQGMEAYTQGLMDLGATVCTRSKPACTTCPLQSECVAYATGRNEMLPTRKPAKAVPEKHTVMLVVIESRQVLLEQRPGHGIWGGLLSLPELNRLITEEVNEAVDMPQTLRQATAAFGVMERADKLQDFTHTFTHYKLHVSPYLLRLKQGQLLQVSHPYCWVGVDQLEKAALPAPVKKLLTRLLLAPDLFSSHS
jgi:A/G-specific adenine glycosylase